MPELDTLAWVVVALAAIMVGISKTGLPGLGILPALLMAHVLPAQKSVGALQFLRCMFTDHVRRATESTLPGQMMGHRQLGAAALTADRP